MRFKIYTGHLGCNRIIAEKLGQDELWDIITVNLCVWRSVDLLVCRLLVRT